MTRSRLIAALLASLFALHLTVVGGLAGARSSDGMAAMAMSGAAPGEAMDGMAAAADVSSSEDGPASDQAPCPEDAPCDLPGMPHCPLVVSCALAVSSPQKDVALGTLLPARAAGASSQLPHTRTSPPELRPPRV
jgi:hypothetical protein